MIAYCIEVPYVSAGLRRTYCKKLEVFECKIEKKQRVGRMGTMDYFYISRPHAIYVFSKKTNQWERKEKHASLAKAPSFSVVADLKTNVDLRSHAFTTPEAAQASKLIMIQHLGESYKQALKELHELYERNVPDIETPLAQLLDTHPDIFI